MTDTNTARAEFEAWALQRNYSVIRSMRDTEHYELQTIQMAWEGWQASRASLPKLNTVVFPESLVGKEAGAYYRAEDVRRAWNTDSGHLTEPVLQGPETRAPMMRDAVEELAQGFDGCMVDAVGGEIDVGEAIRTWAAQQDAIAALGVSGPTPTPGPNAALRPMLCNYCGVVIDSGAACTNDGEFNYCPNKRICEAIGGVSDPDSNRTSPDVLNSDVGACASVQPVVATFDIGEHGDIEWGLTPEAYKLPAGIHRLVVRASTPAPVEVSDERIAHLWTEATAAYKPRMNTSPVHMFARALLDAARGALKGKQ